MSLQYRKIQTLEEFEAVSALEMKIWGAEPIPSHQIMTAAKNGGAVLGAFDGEKLVGYSYAFAGFINGEVYLYSHELGIDPEYQNHGIGYNLKLKQAETAIELGYDKVRWTYDPLEGRNGYLNLVKLGAVCSNYIINCYGELADQLNKGLPSDRFFVDWFIKGPYLAERKARFQNVVLDPQAVLLDWKVNGEGLPVPYSREVSPTAQTPAYLFVPVPAEFQKMKKADSDLAIEWRLKTREIFTQWFNRGWAAVHVLRGQGEPVNYYVLTERDKLELE